MAKIKIVYGSAGGNTEMVCEKVAEVLSACGHKVEMLKAKLTDAGKLGWGAGKTKMPEASEMVKSGNFDLLILASPTYGHGQLEQYFDKFLQGLAAVDMTGWPCAVIGLGDPKYDDDYHIESAKVIMDFLKKKGAKILHMPLRVSRCPLPLLKGHVDKWAEKIAGMVG